MTIKDNIIQADEGKVLVRKSDGFACGKEVTLGYVYFVDGKKLAEPYQEKADDFEEVYELYCNDYTPFYVSNLNYSDIKSEVVKLHYSYDDQIAIMLNYLEEPENEVFKNKYEEMQEWREIAAEVARKYSTSK